MTTSTAHGVTFPLFKQCDARWGSDQMGVKGPGEQSTICGEGCAMSSLAMALAGLGINLPDLQMTPGTLNEYLQSNHLYTCAGHDCNNLVLNAPEALTNRLSLVGEVRPPPALPYLREVVVAQTFIALAHVHNSTHFVLLTDVTGPSTFLVNDPFYNRTTYDYSEMSDVIMYMVHTPASAPTTRVPYQLPMFKQCNSSWGSDVMVKKTICDVGCLMSSISMALNGRGVAIDNQPADPHTLNAWLRTHNGYDDEDGLQEEALPNINKTAVTWPADGMHTTNDLPMMTIRSYLLQGRSVVANVMKGRHFVLVTGWDYRNNDILLVNDPGFDVQAYNITLDVVGWRLFDFAETFV